MLTAPTKRLNLLLLAFSTACLCASLPTHRRRRATNDTPILTLETTTTPAPPATDIWDETTTPEQQTNLPAGVCTYNNKTYAVNEEFSPFPCTSCWCAEGNNTECAMMVCAECISGPPVYVEGQCCPVCQTTTTTEYPTEPTPTPSTSCEENGNVYSDGEEYQRDPCTRCTCVQGQAVCVMMSCRYCDGESVFVTGQCCPDCHTTTSTPPCQFNNLIYYPGEHFAPDRCTFCTCMEGGNVFCEKTYCEFCNGETVPVPGRCCPDCIPYTTSTTPVDTCCQYGEETYALGEEFSPDPCTFCKCEKGGEPVCAVMDCARCDGVSVPVPGRCCPDCIPYTTPAEHVETCCEYNGEHYRFGEEFSPDPCTFCRCWKGGETVCVAAGSCPVCEGEQIPVAGQCCPDCRPYPCEIVELRTAEPEYESKPVVALL